MFYFCDRLFLERKILESFSSDTGTSHFFTMIQQGGRGVSWFVYILRCGDGTLYTGITDDVDRRLAAHRAGRGAKYTRGRGPLELCYTEAQPDKPAALRRELALKKLRRDQKEQLIQTWHRSAR